MADGSPSIRLPQRYSHRERRRIVIAYREWVEALERSNNRTLSAQRLSELLDQEFDEFSETMNTAEPLFKTIWEERGLDPKTIRNLLTCELKLNLLDIHERSFRMLDAFLQIVAQNPPEYL